MHSGRILLLVAVIISVSGCATKSYVESYVGENMAKIDARLDEQNVRISKLTETSRQALERATDAGVLAQGKFLYSVVFTQDGISFETDRSDLSEGDQLQLAELAGDLKANNQNVYLEIQGHTDSTGPDQYNHWLGMQRAEAVRRHLHEQGVALDRMATISYGEEAPLEPNATAEGRTQNRRVEVVVLN